MCFNYSNTNHVEIVVVVIFFLLLMMALFILKLFHFNRNIEYSIRVYIFIICMFFFILLRSCTSFIVFLFISACGFFSFFQLFGLLIFLSIKKNFAKTIWFKIVFFYISIIVEYVEKCGVSLFQKMYVFFLVLISKPNNRKIYINV